MNSINMFMQRMTYASLFILAIGCFTSISISGGSHILLALPGFYFAFKDLKQLKRSDWLSSKGAMAAIFISIVLSGIFAADILPNVVKTIFKGKYFLMGFLAYFAYRNSFGNFIDEKKQAFLLRLFLFATTLA